MNIIFLLVVISFTAILFLRNRQKGLSTKSVGLEKVKIFLIKTVMPVLAVFAGSSFIPFLSEITQSLDVVIPVLDIVSDDIKKYVAIALSLAEIWRAGAKEAAFRVKANLNAAYDATDLDVKTKSTPGFKISTSGNDDYLL